MKQKLLLSIIFKTSVTIFACILFFAAGNAQTLTDGLSLHYNFEGANGNSVSDLSGNGHNATLENNAVITTVSGINVLNLGSANGYLDMGASTGNIIAALNDFSIAVYLYIDAASVISGNGNFAWAFSTSDACSKTEGKYIAYRVNKQRYALSTGGWNKEVVAIEKGSESAKGVWQHVVYTQSGTTGTIYINGEIYKTGTASSAPQSVGATAFNWLGRPQFASDNFLENASYADFRIYSRALSVAEIQSLQTDLTTLNNSINANDVELAKAYLTVEGANAVKADLTLPAQTGKAVSVAWSSSNTAVLADNGTITRPASGQPPVTLTLTATLTKNGYTAAKEFTITVMPEISDAAAATAAAAALQLNTDRCYYLGELLLPAQGSVEGSAIAWESSDTEYITHTGKIIKLPANGAGTMKVVLTARVTFGSFTETKTFTICLNEEEPYSAYLFAYFGGLQANGSDKEDILFALGNDAYNYKALNSDNPVILGKDVSTKGGVRDPHLLRGNDGKYYIVATDMVSSQGWESNHGIVMLKSDDLIHWTHNIVDVKELYPEQFGTITRAWAPQTYYDEQTGKYMIYFSIKRPNEVDLIHYAYANADFTGFESAPQQLFYHQLNKACIDGDIIKKDGKYHLFFKTEGNGDGIKKAVSDNLTSGYVMIDRYLQPTTQPVEGSYCFRLINEDKYMLIYDIYRDKQFGFATSTDLENFTKVTVNKDFAPRHGAIIPITATEAARLEQEWGNAAVENPVSDNKKIKIFPTNVNDILNIRLDTENQPFSVSIIDIAGRTLKSRKLSGANSTLDCSQLRSGWYLVKIESGGKVYVNHIYKVTN
jgi:hypothetical protein